ncbi:hypothetical protein CRG98_033637 [Punica granatum]|uniref:Uncharacterized protein n=1 Tax=Punica granatum TaxID=22663 RepID=A0A2I0IPT3_PUNGR|nr:hypothetical protein CRG98_033637 [Punica granatum]
MTYLRSPRKWANEDEGSYSEQLFSARPRSDVLLPSSKCGPHLPQLGPDRQRLNYAFLPPDPGLRLLQLGPVQMRPNLLGLDYKKSLRLLRWASFPS